MMTPEVLAAALQSSLQSRPSSSKHIEEDALDTDSRRSHAQQVCGLGFVRLMLRMDDLS